MTALDWTIDDSRALDAWARTYRRSPLQRDERLRELLAEHCIECDRPMRPSDRTAEEFPGTVPSATRGTCHRCYKAARSRRLRGVTS